MNKRSLEHVSLKALAEISVFSSDIIFLTESDPDALTRSDIEDMFIQVYLAGFEAASGQENKVNT